MTPPRLKQGLTLALLAGLAVWPGVHFLAHRAWQIDPWHGAGWAMYGVPRTPDDPALTQRDGTLLVASISQQHLLQRVMLRALVWRNAYDPTHDLARLLEAYPPGSIDGLHLRVVTRQYDRHTARFLPPERFHDVALASPAPPDPRVRYPVTPQTLVGTTWAWAPPDAVPTTFGVTGTTQGVAPLLLSVPPDGALPQAALTTCGDYPACATSAWGEAALYQEGDQLWFATCFVPTAADAPLDWQTQDDTHREAGYVIVWRSPATLCFVPAVQLAAQRNAGP